MATGGDRNAACRFTNTSVPHRIGSMLKCFSSGRKMGTKMTMISVHSSGHPSRKMIACDRIMNCTGVMLRDNTHCSTSACPPRIAQTKPKIKAFRRPAFGGCSGGATESWTSQLLYARYGRLGGRLLMNDHVPPRQPERARDQSERHECHAKVLEQGTIADAFFVGVDGCGSRGREQRRNEADQHVVRIGRLKFSHPR